MALEEAGISRGARSATGIESARVGARCPESDHEHLRLNVGCGLDIVPGYQNLDNSPSLRIRDSRILRTVAGCVERLYGRPVYTRFPAEVSRFDVTSRWPYADHSVEVIYSSHMLEHLARPQAEAFLRQAYRILTPRGVLRLALPDLERIAREYLRRIECVREQRLDEIPCDDFMRSAGLGFPWSLRREPLRALQWVRGREAHLWMWDGASLATLCRRVGFAEVAERGYRESSIPEIDRLDLERRREDSFFLEAVR